MLKLQIKSAALLAVISSSNVIADELQLKNQPVPSVSKVCPSDFYTLPLYPNAKYCQSFSTELPASLSYFAKSDQQAMRNFYLEKLGKAEEEKRLKGRIMLQYDSGQKVVIISEDGAGSQIDILVKSAS